MSQSYTPIHGKHTSQSYPTQQNTNFKKPIKLAADSVAKSPTSTSIFNQYADLRVLQCVKIQANTSIGMEFIPPKL